LKAIGQHALASWRSTSALAVTAVFVDIFVATFVAPCRRDKGFDKGFDEGFDKVCGRGGPLTWWR